MALSGRAHSNHAVKDLARPSWPGRVCLSHTRPQLTRAWGLTTRRVDLTLRGAESQAHFSTINRGDRILALGNCAR